MGEVGMRRRERVYREVDVIGPNEVDEIVYLNYIIQFAHKLISSPGNATEVSGIIEAAV